MGQLLLRLPKSRTQLVDRPPLAFGQLGKADGEEGSFNGVERARAVRIPQAPKLVEDLRQLRSEQGHPSTRYAPEEQGSGSPFERYSPMSPPMAKHPCFVGVESLCVR